MDLLQSVLRTCQAEKYIENFKNHGIDAFMLKILSDEDLSIIGVEEEDIRKLILKNVLSLQIPAERKIETVVNRQYALVVLSTMSMHLDKHFANLTYALKRDDIDECDVKITPALDCLEKCFTSLGQELVDFEKKVFKMEDSKKKRKFHLLFPTITVTALVLFACSRYFGYVRLK